jgi:hypothetical protein
MEEEKKRDFFVILKDFLPFLQNKNNQLATSRPSHFLGRQL